MDTHPQGQNISQDGPLEPEVLNYLDYREYLAAWFQWKKLVNPRFSGALFAKKAGFSSHTLLGMVTRGQRNLTYSSLNSFLKGLGLKGKRAKYLEKLVYYNQAKSPDEKQQFFTELVQLNKGMASAELRSLNNYSLYLSSWYVGAINELVHLEDFQPDPTWISKKLKNSLTPREAKKAWEILLEMEMVRFDEQQNRYIAANDSLEIDPRILDFGIINYHRQYLKKAMEALEGEDRSQRELSSLTVAISEKELEKLKDKINEFRKELNLKISNSTEPRDQVIALNTQLLVLTSKEN